MENLNSVVFEEVKKTLLETKAEEFNIDQYIKQIESIKKKHTYVVWTNDEYDNWHNE